MNADKRRLIRTALWILAIMAMFTAAVWITLFVSVRPARGEPTDRSGFIGREVECIRFREHTRGGFGGEVVN